MNPFQLVVAILCFSSFLPPTSLHQNIKSYQFQKKKKKNSNHITPKWYGDTILPLVEGPKTSNHFTLKWFGDTILLLVEEPKISLFMTSPIAYMSIRINSAKTFQQDTISTLSLLDLLYLCLTLKPPQNPFPSIHKHRFVSLLVCLCGCVCIDLSVCGRVCVYLREKKMRRREVNDFVVHEVKKSGYTKKRKK